MDLTTILIIVVVAILIVVLVLTIKKKNKSSGPDEQYEHPKAESGGNPQAAEKAPPHEENYGTPYEHKEDAPQLDTDVPEATENLKEFTIHPNAWCAGDTCQLRIAYKHADGDNLVLTVQRTDGGAEQELASGEAEFEKVYEPGQAPFDKEGEYIVRLKKGNEVIGEEHLYSLPTEGGAVKVHSHIVMPVQSERKRILAKDTIVLSQFTTGKENEFTICSKGAVLTGITLLPEGRHQMCGNLELAIRRKSEVLMEYGKLEPGDFQELTPAAPIDQGIHLQMSQYCGDDEFPAGDVVSWSVELILECSSTGKISANPENRETREE